ncbi:MAG: sulfate transporter CysZ [Hahellaceae bacterium]|nr:sulfate transporter CysZ [Hahellaceae bacterium]MCP5170530.1 sulfate transporter CysZ [Hahellaceae bacterium]
MWLPQLRWLVIIPLGINVLLFMALFHQGSVWASAGIAAAMSALPDWLGFLDSLFWLLYGAVFLLIFVYSFVTVANLIGSPFYGVLAERVAHHLKGEAADSGQQGIVALVWTSVSREIHKILYYLPRVMLLVLLGMIPGLNLIGALLWFLFSAWMMTLQYTDFSADNQGLSFKALRQSLQGSRLSGLTFGALVALSNMLPVLNLLAVPAAVCGGTHFWLQRQGMLENPSTNGKSLL